MVLITSMRVCLCIHLIDFMWWQIFILHLIGDLKFSNLNSDNMCAYLDSKKCSKYGNKKVYVGFEDLLQEDRTICSLL